MYERCIQQQCTYQTQNDNYNSSEEEKKTNNFIGERDENIFRPVNALHSMRLHIFMNICNRIIVRFFMFYIGSVASAGAAVSAFITIVRDFFDP